MSEECPLTSETLFFESVKWIAPATVVIPYRGRFLIGQGHGNDRKLIDVVGEEELPFRLGKIFKDEERAYKTRREREEAERSAYRSKPMAVAIDISDLF